MLAEETTSKVVEVLREELNVQTIVLHPHGGTVRPSRSPTLSSTCGCRPSWCSCSSSSQQDGCKKEPERAADFGRDRWWASRTGHLTGQIGEKGKKYYYLILTIFVFIFVTNLIGLIPKPELMKPYTPTANINVTFDRHRACSS